MTKFNYITDDIFCKTKSKMLSAAIDKNELSIILYDGSVFAIEGSGCSDRSYRLAIKETKRLFPQYHYLYDDLTKAGYL